MSTIKTRTEAALYRPPCGQTANVEPGPERRIFAERSASFIGFTLLGGRLLERAGAFGQVLLIAAVLGSTTRADLYFIASIVPLTIGNVVGEALAAAVLPRAATAASRRRRGSSRLGSGSPLSPSSALPPSTWSRLPSSSRGRLRPVPAVCCRGSLSRRSGSSSASAPTARRRCSTTSATFGRPCAGRPPRSSGLCSPSSWWRWAAASCGSASRSRAATASRCSCWCSRSSRSAAVDLRAAGPLGDPRGPLALAEALGVRRQRRYRRAGLRPDRDGSSPRRSASARSPRSRMPAASRTRRPFSARRSARASTRASCALTPPRRSTMSANASSRDSA